MEPKQMDSDVIEIDLREIFSLLWHHIIELGLMLIVCAGIGFILSSYVMHPTYESTTKIYILNRQSDTTVTYSDVQLGTQLTKDYAQLVQSRYVLEQVIEDLGLEDETYDTLSGKVSVTTPTDTRVLAITVTYGNPMDAMNIANDIREVAAVHIKNVMDIEAVNVVETANYPDRKSGPSVSKWTAVCGLLGCVLLAAVFIIIYLVDDTIKTSEDVEKYLGISTLALIPTDDSRASRGRKKK